MRITDDIKELKTKLKELAEAINSFKSESVQTRIVELLFGVNEPPEESQTVDTPTHRTRKRKKATVAAMKKNRPAPDLVSKQKPTARRGGKGSFAAVSKLVDDGFFSAPKTIRNIVDHCAHNRGLHFKANEISPALLRLLRDEKVSRKKNKDNQYEYKAK